MCRERRRWSDYAACSPLISTPTKSMMSLSAMGTPWNRTAAFPARRAGSDARASSPYTSPKVSSRGSSRSNPREQRLDEFFRGQFAPPPAHPRRRLRSGIRNFPLSFLPGCRGQPRARKPAARKLTTFHYRSPLRRCASTKRQKCMSNLDLLPARTAAMAAEKTLHFAESTAPVQARLSGRFRTFDDRSPPGPSLRRLRVPVHHIAEHASDRKIVCILLGDKPGDPFPDIQRSEVNASCPGERR